MCKDCVQFLAEDSFSFRKDIPEVLTKTRYCGTCFDTHVAPALELYHEVMERAKAVFFFFITQRAAIHLLERTKDKLRVEKCVDRNETILRLGFLAADQGLNAIIEGEIIHQKVRKNGYQSTLWSGTGYGARVDAERLEKYLKRDEF
ncbi:hypothetical protein WDW86_13220 [Bdellovibrionota bacterium FG-2]